MPTVVPCKHASDHQAAADSLSYLQGALMAFGMRQDPLVTLTARCSSVLYCEVKPGQSRSRLSATQLQLPVLPHSRSKLEP